MFTFSNIFVAPAGMVRHRHPLFLPCVCQQLPQPTSHLRNCMAYNHQTLHEASAQHPESACTLTRWPWPIFHTPVTVIFPSTLRNLANYKTYNHQTLHEASARHPDSPRTLSRWPWPIFQAPVTLPKQVRHPFPQISCLLWNHLHVCKWGPGHDQDGQKNQNVYLLKRNKW